MGQYSSPQPFKFLIHDDIQFNISSNAADSLINKILKRHALPCPADHLQGRPTDY
jgi:hypothetical protein